MAKMLKLRFQLHHGYCSRRTALAPAPDFLQGPRHWGIPAPMGSPARAQRLLRDGEAARRVPWRSPDVQPGSVTDLAVAGLRVRGDKRSVLEGGFETRCGSHTGRTEVRAGVLV